MAVFVGFLGLIVIVYIPIIAFLMRRSRSSRAAPGRSGRIPVLGDWLRRAASHPTPVHRGVPAACAVGSVQRADFEAPVAPANVGGAPPEEAPKVDASRDLDEIRNDVVVAERPTRAAALMSTDPVDALQRLSALHARALLSDEEFDRLKAELLRRL